MGIFNAYTMVNVQEDATQYFERINKEDLQEEVRYLTNNLHELQEDMLKISDAFDRRGTTELTGWDERDAVEIPLTTVKKVAKTSRAMNAMNPFVKRGVNARISYIWGKGVTFDGVESVQEKIDLNYHKLFSPQALEEYERVLATDGNAFTALPVGDKADVELEEAFRVGLDEIVGIVANPLDREEIWYYKREYSVTKTNARTGEVNTDKIQKYYVSLPYWRKLQRQGKNLPRNWNKVGVEQNYVIQHVAVNKQVGWRWGVPDIMPVIFWAAAYKEYLEDNAMLVKAYSRLAWQIKASSAAGAQAAAAQVMAAPTRDPMTGEARTVGGTGIQGLGGELSPVANVGSSVDFSKGSPLASAIASGLEVSLVVITSDPGSGNRATAETLDLPTLKAMESRQNLHSARLLEIFEHFGATVRASDKTTLKPREAQEAKAENTEGTGTDIAIVTWPQIETDTTKDRITALGTAVELGILYKQEARKEAIDVLGIAPYKAWDDLPTMEDDPAAQEKMQQEKEAADLAFQQAQQQANAESSAIAAQGKSGGVAAKGGSQNTNNSARDNRAKNINNS